MKFTTLAKNYRALRKRGLTKEEARANLWEKRQTRRLKTSAALRKKWLDDSWINIVRLDWRNILHEQWWVLEKGMEKILRENKKQGTRFLMEAAEMAGLLSATEFIRDWLLKHGKNTQKEMAEYVLHHANNPADFSTAHPNDRLMALTIGLKDRRLLPLWVRESRGMRSMGARFALEAMVRSGFPESVPAIMRAYTESRLTSYYEQVVIQNIRNLVSEPLPFVSKTNQSIADELIPSSSTGLGSVNRYVLRLALLIGKIPHVPSTIPERKKWFSHLTREVELISPEELIHYFKLDQFTPARGGKNV